MRLSTRARYGLRGLFDIAYHARGGPAHVKDIARRQGVTPRYLEQIFHVLKRSGLLVGQRGPRGGYSLGRPAEAITLADVVRATEGPIRLTGDPARARSDRPPTGEAASAGPAFASVVWTEISERIEAILDDVSLADLCTRAEAEGLPREPELEGLMYFI